MNKKVVRWLEGEAARLDAVLGIRITGGQVRVQPVPGTNGEYAIINGVDFEAVSNEGGYRLLVRTEGGLYSRLKVIREEMEAPRPLGVRAPEYAVAGAPGAR